ncbi:hypothetical protein ACLKA6_013349 [Drosophila palustris]
MICGADAAERLHLNENDRCYKVGLPLGRCKLPENCQTLPEYIKAGLFTMADVLECGFKDAFSAMMYCCPDDPPPSRAIPTRQPNRSLTGTHLVSLEYLKPVTLDDVVYRCTGIVLTPSYVLATTKCIGKDIIGRPNKVLLGSTDSRLYVDSQTEIEIKSYTSYNNELTLFELEKEIPSSQLLENVSKATLCNRLDLSGEPNLFAVGYAYDQHEGSNCALFSQQLRLVNSDECINVRSSRQIEGIRWRNSHLCVLPENRVLVSDAYPRNNCLKCLTASSSVLHLQRPDGSQCVAGIATPTTDECLENRLPLYYTNIVSNNGVNDFLNRIINVGTD